MTMERYWVVGGEYSCLGFKTLKNGRPEVIGPFDSRDEAGEQRETGNGRAHDRSPENRPRDLEPVSRVERVPSVIGPQNRQPLNDC